MTSQDYKNNNSGELQKTVTVEVLLDFTDDILLPRIADIIDEKIVASTSVIRNEFRNEISQLNHDLKIYIDQKLGDYTSDIFNRLDKKYQQDKRFKEKMIEILKRSSIATAEEVAYLEGLAGA